ncbi:DMT family transporter [Salinibacter altiplanensis]|uniref:DMT family transporter n=1 Tax=Salinibacter altiplanensis TaxID=1803181 RepID=UPI00131A5165|nr:DMT family transporter [Salinibacter altiplanensis]
MERLLPARLRASGLLWMGGAAFFFSLMTLFIKLAGQRLPSQQIVLIRSAAALIYSYLAARWVGVSPWGHRRRLLVVRGLFGFGAMVCFYLALTKLPLADATAIFFSNPVLAACFAAIFLGEQLGTREVGAALLSFGGICLIAQPTFLFGSGGESLNLLYVGVTVLAAIFAGAGYATVRALRTSEHPTVVVFYLPLIGTIGSVPTMGLVDMAWPTPYEWLLSVGGVAGAGQIALVLLTEGLSRARTGRAMPVTYLQIVFAAVWGALFFEEMPDLLTVVGALMVGGGTLVVARG